MPRRNARHGKLVIHLRVNSAHVDAGHDYAALARIAEDGRRDHVSAILALVPGRWVVTDVRDKPLRRDPERPHDDGYVGFVADAIRPRPTPEYEQAVRDEQDAREWMATIPPCDDCGRTGGDHNPEVEH